MLALVNRFGHGRVPKAIRPQGGGTLKFSYISRLDHFLGFKILNFNIFWGLQKKHLFFLDMKIL